jgi:ribosome biogenesis GTPase
MTTNTTPLHNPTKPHELVALAEAALLADCFLFISGSGGAGKTSIVCNEISKAMGKGKHTTVTRQMFPLDGGGYVADTPGWKSLALWDTEPEELDAYFPELRDLVPHCQFSDCTHQHEPGCAVLQALKDGKIFAERYESYVKLRLGRD